MRRVVRFHEGQVLAHYLRVGLAAHPDASRRHLSNNSFNGAIEDRRPYWSSTYEGAVDIEQEQALSGHKPDPKEF